MPDLVLPKLGKKRATPPRVRRMRELLRLGAPAKAPPVPASCDWSQHVSAWPMLDNDQIGDCTIAAVGHAVQCWTAAAGDSRVMTNAEAIAGYEAFGYVPGDPSTDRGANAQDVLTSWIGAGFEVGGQSDVLAGFCALDTSNSDDVRAGVSWLGVVYAGLALPAAVQGADAWDCGPIERNGAPVSGPWAPGSWGGHAVPVVGYSSRGVLAVTWAKLLWMTWPFWRTYADEAYGLLSRDFASAAIPAEAWATLEADMQALRESVGEDSGHVQGSALQDTGLIDAHGFPINRVIAPKG